MAEGLLKLVHGINKTYDGRFIMVGTEMSKPINRPTGSYDKNILCTECDNKLGKYDKEAIRFCKRNDLKLHPSGVAFTLDNVNQENLVLFALSYAWRASITTLEEYNRISLGEQHEERIRQILLKELTDKVSFYQLLIAKFSLPEDKKTWGLHVLNPINNRFTKVNVINFYLPNLYKFTLKVDKQSFPDEFSSGVVGSTSKVLIYDLGDYRESNEFRIMHRSIMKGAGVK